MSVAREPRAGRETTTRAADARPVWKPLDQYPVPVVPGLRFRWMRTQVPGQPGVYDTRNMSRRFREGWVVTPASDHPELQMQSDQHSQFSGGIEVAGQLLCQIDQKVADARNEFYRQQGEQQMSAVDNSLFKANVRGDHGMHILNPKRRTRVALGKRAESDSEAED